MYTGRIVKSIAGRDKGYLLAVIGEDKGFVLIADGKERPVEHPKRKNVKHISFTEKRLCKDEFISNKSLRKALKKCDIKEDF
ncbi:MAG: hypothetical protein E7568_00310 [Ruminococcaceae bacterium]|nr:hypothetical protein [Oscillospiraceae bacterium]